MLRGVSLHWGGCPTWRRSCSHSLSPIPLQIAPAEGPEASERMVIITGPPEAQFKVRLLWRQEALRSVPQVWVLLDIGTSAPLGIGGHGWDRCPLVLIPLYLLLRPRGEYLGS